jgi:transposase
MLGLGHQHRYYLYGTATDMRKSFDGLSGLVRNELGRNPLDGDIYIFLNRRRTMVKLLQWDKSGYALYSKRLEQGSYELPKVIHIDGKGFVLKWSDLVLILEGISLKSVRYRKRYAPEEKNNEKNKKVA